LEKKSMVDEEKQAGKAEATEKTTPSSSDQQKPPAGPDKPVQPAMESGSDSVTAVTHKVDRSTEKLSVGEMAGLPQTLPRSFGGEIGTAKWFRRLPVSMSASELPSETPRWRIELVGLAPAAEPMGLEIVGDTVVGRGRVGTEPSDLDLDVYGALEKGVSRRHGMFRPTTNHLYIIDLGSTNGTLHNGIPLGPGVARALKHNDTITLGRFSFTIKIIDGPFIRRTPEPLPAVAINTEETEQTKPMGPMDVAELKAAKSKLTPPTQDSSSPGTNKLPSDEGAKLLTPPSGTQMQSSGSEGKLSADTGRVSAPHIGLMSTESKPSAPEARPPATDVKPPEGEDKAIDQAAKTSAEAPKAQAQGPQTSKEEPKPPAKEEEKQAGKGSVLGE
jgi:hypothetical protein